MSFFSFFRKKEKKKEEQKEDGKEFKSVKDYEYFLEELVCRAKGSGWIKSTEINEELVGLAQETCLHVEKRMYAKCREAGDSSTVNVMYYVIKTCYWAGIISCWHYARNKPAINALGLYRAITSESEIECAEHYALYLMNMNKGRGRRTPEGENLAAFIKNQAEELKEELVGILLQCSGEEFDAALAAARKAMFVCGTIVGSSLMPSARP